MTDWLARAREVHPDISVDEHVFHEFVTRRDALVTSHLPDLYLACACMLGVEAAVAQFEARCISQVGRAISRIDTSATFIAEIQQRLRDKLIVGGADGKPRIAEYAGRGPLAAFVRVAAIREALMEKRAARPMSDEIDHAIVAGDATLELVRREYKTEFHSALRDAIERLDRHERAALRMNYLDNLSIDQIAKLYRVHRATAARWITRAQERVRELTHEALRRKLQLGDSELESLIGDLMSVDALSSGMLASSAA